MVEVKSVLIDSWKKGGGLEGLAVATSSKGHSLEFQASVSNIFNGDAVILRSRRLGIVMWRNSQRRRSNKTETEAFQCP